MTAYHGGHKRTPAVDGDERRRSVEHLLGKFTTEQLLRLRGYSDPMVLDQYNYHRGRF